ncbi:MAG: TetR/AcrR family transcriptional regulator [Myxococcota bacterium]
MSQSGTRDATDLTRATLLGVARRTFAAKGYAGTSLRDIVEPVGMTKGALYHHFKNKAEVLEAVYTELERELVDAVGRALAKAPMEPWARLEAALDAFFEASSEPAYVRIVLQEAPVVLLGKTRTIDQDVGLALVEELLGGLMDAGELPELPLRPLAGIVLAATGDVAIEMAASDDLAKTRAEGRRVIDALFEGLRRQAR